VSAVVHPYDETYYVGGSKSNYDDYRLLEAAIDTGFMPEVLRYAEAAGRDRSARACLDLGCAMGFYVERLSRLGWEAHGLDLSEYAVAEGRGRGVANLTVGSVDALPYEDASFDFVFSIDVVEHVEPAIASAMVAEIRRVLRDGGLCLLATPNFLTNVHWNAFTPGFEDRDETHVNYQSAESLRRLLDGFRSCTVYGHTPFVEQFRAWDASRAWDFRLLRTTPFRQLGRHVAWRLLGRSVEYSSYLHAVAVR
jgi:SAM-dependent methyltransferase